jgi:TRAP-type C4-dicarboxylate transport system permease small subunit
VNDDAAWLKIVGAVVATGLGAVLGVTEAFLVPLRLGSIYVPVSLALAILLNPALAWFAVDVTGRKAAAALPALAWCVIWFLAASKTTEGDLVITGDNWVGLVTLLAGPIAFALGIFAQVMFETSQAARRKASRESAEKSVKASTVVLRDEPSKG